MARVQATVIGRPYGRRQVGETMTLGSRDAVLLERLGRVRLIDMPPEQQYATRDMVAGAAPVPVKRGRGRPRKYPKPDAA